MQIRDTQVLHFLTDLVSKLEKETDETIAILSSELKSEVGSLESRITDFLSNTTNRFNTQDYQIGSMYYYPVGVISRIVKLEEGLGKVKTTLAAKSESLTTLARIHTSITTCLEE